MTMPEMTTAEKITLVVALYDSADNYRGLAVHATTQDNRDWFTSRANEAIAVRAKLTDSMTIGYCHCGICPDSRPEEMSAEDERALDERFEYAHVEYHD